MTGRFPLNLFLLIVGLALGLGACDISGRRLVSTDLAKEAVILAVNDVYRIEGVADGGAGGIARLRALRAELERTHPDLLVLHGGDVLGPSFLSRRYKGEQMIDALNRLDGQPQLGAFDPHLFVTFGNHEFDDSRCDDPGVLRQRVMESEFTWLSSNIDFADCHGQPPLLPASDRVKDHAIVEVGGLRLGLFGLTVDFEADKAATRPAVRDQADTARAMSKRLREEGAQVVVALTHLPVAEDLVLLDSLKADGPDLIVGGHDHTQMAVPGSDPRIFKADADARTATIITITLDGDGNPRAAHRVERLDHRVPKDPMVQQVVDHWLSRHAAEYCARRNETDTCLDEVLGRTETAIEGEELKNRGRETGIGDWIADRMRQARPDADVAILNSGTLRLNYDLPAGATLRRRHLEELFGFPVPLLVVEVSGAVLWRAMDNALASRGNGGWAHLSGVALAIAPDGKLERLVVRRADGAIERVTTDSTARYRVVTSAFLACGGDGYDFGIDLAPFAGDAEKCRADVKARIDAAGAPIDLFDQVKGALSSEAAIKPRIDNRICEPGQPACLIADWERALP